MAGTMADDAAAPRDGIAATISEDDDKTVEYRTALDAALAPTASSHRPARSVSVDWRAGWIEVQSRGRAHCHVVCSQTLRRSRSL